VFAWLAPAARGTKDSDSTPILKANIGMVAFLLQTLDCFRSELDQIDFIG